MKKMMTSSINRIYVGERKNQCEFESRQKNNLKERFTKVPQ